MRKIKKAFDYDESEISQELIVRYVQSVIEMSYEKMEIGKFNNDYPLLRDYYENCLMKNLIIEYRRIKFMNQINDESGIALYMEKIVMVKRRR